MEQLLNRPEKEKKRVRLTVAYDGTNYHGWQIQNNGITIESELNRCLTDLLREPVEVIGASRTDSGVHALGNIAVFDTTSRMPAEKISYALNQRLPEDIRIQKSEQVPQDWHPRRCDSRKTYEYRIYRAQFPMPVKRLYSLFTYYELDVNRMQEAAAYLEGEHDFKSFCQTGAQVESTVRTIYSVEVEEQGENDLVIRVCGNGFLYNMVRIIAGTLLDIGQGKRDPMDIFTILEARDRSTAGPTAPAHGLTLMKYEFIDYLFKQELLQRVIEKVKKFNERNNHLNLKLGFRLYESDSEYNYYEVNPKTLNVQ